MSHDLGMKSKLHPKYKTKYRVGNWAEYDPALVQRGDITLWISTDATDAWRPALSGTRGGQRKFSDHAIEAALMLRLVFTLPLRQAKGFLGSNLSLMGVNLEAPDHTTLSRRSQHLDVDFHLIPANEPIHLIDEVEGDIASFTADAAYDTRAIYDAAAARGAKVIVPPMKTATRSRRRRPWSNARNRTIMRVTEIGRRRWKKESGYHRQARAVDIIGGSIDKNDRRHGPAQLRRRYEALEPVAGLISAR